MQKWCYVDDKACGNNNVSMGFQKNLENLGNFPKAWAYCKGSEDLAKGKTSELKDKLNLQFPSDTSGDITKKSECNNNINTDEPKAKKK